MQQQIQIFIMKRFLAYIFLPTVCALVLSGCEYSFSPGNEPCTNSAVISLHISQNQWQWSADGGYFYYTFNNINELTTNVFNNGIVSCYREYNIGTPDAYQIPLPQTLHKAESVTENGNTYYAFYTQTIDYSFLPGTVEIVLTNSDYAYGTENPESMNFRLCLLWNK